MMDWKLSRHDASPGFPTISEDGGSQASVAMITAVAAAAGFARLHMRFLRRRGRGPSMDS